jgi:cell division protein FtsN
LLENPVLIEVTDETDSLKCEYFVQIGAYGNKKYAIEAKNMLSNQVPNIFITEVYSSLQPGKLLNSVISGPYKNKSAANNAKEKITIEGFEPNLRTRCEQK